MQNVSATPYNGIFHDVMSTTNDLLLVNVGPLFAFNETMNPSILDDRDFNKTVWTFGPENKKREGGQSISCPLAMRLLSLREEKSFPLNFP